MMNESYIDFESFYGTHLRIIFITHQLKPSKLVVLFPGKGYTCDMPLLYYAGVASYYKGCDVLLLEYGFYRAVKKYDHLSDFQRVVSELAEIVDKCNGDSYAALYFISKSLGTLFAGELSTKMGNRNIKNLYLTPLEQTIPYMLDSHCLAVTGSKDSFASNNTEIIKNKLSSKIVIIPDADHSFEIESDTKKVLRFCNRLLSCVNALFFKT